MTHHAWSPKATAPGLPVLFVVDADREARTATETALARRFGSDYRVLAADSAEAGLAALERLAQAGEEVALVAADLGLPGTDGVEFLGRARALHPGASGWGWCECSRQANRASSGRNCRPPAPPGCKGRPSRWPGPRRRST